MSQRRQWAGSIGVVVCGAMIWAVGLSARQGVAAAEESGATVNVSSSAPRSPGATAGRDNEIAAQFNGTQWAIELTPMGGKKGTRPRKDTLAFEHGTVTSEELASDGYPTSNYTLTVGDDGISVWETMQTSERDGVVFWRGELHGNTMRGILSKHPLEGDPKDYVFVGHQAGVTAQPAASLEEGTAVSSPGGTTTQAEEAAQAETPSHETAAPKKPRKGWFW